MAKVVIEDIQTILTQPGRSRLAIVKVVTSEPGLYGLGCATFTQRIHAVAAALDRHLKPFLLGRDVARIEETWQMAMVHGYWRNGPVLNNAISGVDQALWDIKGKVAGLPVYDLLGGKCREAAHVYVHADGATREQVSDRVQAFLEDGYRYVRVQMGGYGGTGDTMVKPTGAPPGAYFDPRRYARNMLDMIEHVRSTVGDDAELLHDVHERLAPIDAVQFAKDVEQFRLFFLEDVLAPEDLAWFQRIREQSSTPLAMGELFNHPLEWRTVIENRLIDFIRMHVSQMGGITPARKAADMAHSYGIRTAWHGPGDLSPVGHAANAHLDMNIHNFGIQESVYFNDDMREVFPGAPTMKNGYMYVHEAPGLGIDINEKAAAKHPFPEHPGFWKPLRRRDGTAVRP